MALTVNLTLPPALEKRIRDEFVNLDKDVTEAYVLQLFREGRLSHFELSEVLHLDRFQTDAYLKQRGVFEGSPTMADLEADRATLEELFKREQ
jgi:predicted HTH domain antitoxin